MPPLSPLWKRSHQYGNLNEEQLTVFRRVLDEAPGSIRALADAAGVSHALLIRIRQGDRSLTPETVHAVVRALWDWGDRCHSLADALENAPRAPRGRNAT